MCTDTMNSSTPTVMTTCMMNAGQAFTMHVVITVGVLLFVVSVHIGLIRRRGVAPPPGAEALEVPDDQLTPQPEA